MQLCIYMHEAAVSSLVLPSTDQVQLSKQMQVRLVKCNDKKNLKNYRGY